MLKFVFARRRVALASVLFVAVSVLVVHPTLARSIDADVWNLPDLNDELRATADQNQQLNDEADDIARRIRVKESIIDELVGGRITLTEATEQFAVLNASRPHYLTLMRSHYPGASDQEAMARNVISFAQTRVSPDDRPAVISRLEAELHQMLSATATE